MCSTHTQTLCPRELWDCTCFTMIITITLRAFKKRAHRKKKRVIYPKENILKKQSRRTRGNNKKESIRGQILSWCKLEHLHCLQWSCSSLSNVYALAQSALLIKSLNCYLQSFPYAAKFILLLATISFFLSKKKKICIRKLFTLLYFFFVSSQKNISSCYNLAFSQWKSNLERRTLFYKLDTYPVYFSLIFSHYKASGFFVLF